MGVANQRFAREAAPELGESLVVDRREIADFESDRATLAYDLLKGSNNLRVELETLVSIQLVHRPIMANSFSINAIRCHRLVGIGDDHDARTNRNFFTFQTFRIAGAVKVLMMVEHDRHQGTQCGGGFQNRSLWTASSGGSARLSSEVYAIR